MLIELRAVVEDHVRTDIRRGLYMQHPDAATLAAAFAEALALAGRMEDAKRFHARLLSEFRQYPVFRSSMEEALAISPVLS